MIWSYLPFRTRSANTGPDLISGWEYSDCASDRRRRMPRMGTKFFYVIYFSPPPRKQKKNCCFFLSRNISIKPPFNNNKLRKFQQVAFFCVSSSINLMKIMLHVIPFRHRTQREKELFFPLSSSCTYTWCRVRSVPLLLEAERNEQTDTISRFRIII